MTVQPHLPLLLPDHNAPNEGVDPPRRGGNTKRLDNRLKVAKRVEFMISLKIAGLSWHEIARQVGYGTPQSARRTVTRFFRATPSPTAEEMRRIENERLDVAHSIIWPRVLRGDMDAFDRFVRLSARRSALNGLDLQPLLVVAPNGNGLDANGHDPELGLRLQRIAAMPPDEREQLAALCRKHGLIGSGPGPMP